MLRYCCVLASLSLLSGATHVCAFQNGWHQLTPPRLDAVDFIPLDSLTLVTVGVQGTIGKTTNGGISWEILHGVDGVTGTLRAVSFPTPNLGFAVGERWKGDSAGVLLRTDDGGSSWTAVERGNSLPPLISVSFAPDVKYGWLSGEGNTLMRTVNGGDTWEVMSPTPSLSFGRLCPVDSANGFTIADRVLWRTRDGGATWDSVYRFTYLSVYAVDFIDTLLGWAAVVGTSGLEVILKTTDGGMSWTAILREKYSRFRDVKFIDSLHGWIAGETYDQLCSITGETRETTDGGRTWTRVLTSPTSHSKVRTGPNGSVWVRAGNEEVFRRIPSTGTWMKAVEVKYGFPRAVSHVPGLDRWVVAGGGYCMQYDQMALSIDRGTSWLDAIPPGDCYCPMLSVSFPEGVQGWAAGDGILSSTDGGASWKVQVPHTSSGFLDDIFFADTLDGWAVGKRDRNWDTRGRILHTSDGGRVWIDQELPSLAPLHSVWFVSPTTGVCVGDSGAIFRTSDGGNTWLPVDRITDRALRSVYFVSPVHGWTVGDYGAILRTGDGGLTWSHGESFSTAYLKDVFFIDTLQGWSVGNGVILSSNNGGATWDVQESDLRTDLYTIDFIDASYGLTVGNMYTTLALDCALSSVPNAPRPASPPQGESGVPSTISLQWYPPTGGGSYHVQVSSDSLFERVEVDCRNLRYSWRQIRYLNPATTYYWRVRATNVVGFSDWSAIHSFTTGEYPPSQVELLSPDPAAVVGPDTITFVWKTASMGPKRYWMELSLDSLFSDSVIDSTITDTTVTLPGLHTTMGRWWKVRAGNDFGWGPFSSPRTFTILPTSIEAPPGVPAEYSLEQNWPNPFNPTTVVSYQLPVASQVRLVVFDLLGRDVATLVDENKPAGVHTAEFDGSGLASGVYLYRMTAGIYTSTRKLLLLR